MSSHTIAIIMFGAFVFQVGCSLGVEKDARPWTAPRVASLIGGLLFVACATWLAVRALT